MSGTPSERGVRTVPAAGRGGRPAPLFDTYHRPASRAREAGVDAGPPALKRPALSRSRQRLRPRHEAGSLRAALAAALLLLAGAFLALPPGPAHAQTAQTVENDWALKPAGIGPGDSFRLLFVTSTRRNAESSNIADYNGFVQGRANAGHMAIRGFSGQFRALISTSGTSGVHARDNTATTHTTMSPGVPIYWLNGAKAADDYADFYNGNWDSNVNRNEFGNTMGVAALFPIWTGSSSDGTGASACPSSLGTVDRRAGTAEVVTGRAELNTLEVGGCALRAASSGLRHLYGLSPVITVSLRPGQVTGVQVDQVTHDSIRVRWTKPGESSSRPITSFGINTRTRNAAGTGWIVDDGPGGTTNAEGWIWRANPDAGATSHTVTGLPSSVLQQVRVFARAVQSGQTPPTLYGDSSAPVQFTTLSAAPGAPAAPTVSGITAESAVVSWSDPTHTGASAIHDHDVDVRPVQSPAAAWSESEPAIHSLLNPRRITLTGYLTRPGVGDRQTVVLAPETAYQVRVRANNRDGMNTRRGAWSPVATFTTAAANAVPAFGATSYTFTLAENADGGTNAIAVGMVSATDADTADTVSYSITAGNTGNVFAIGASTGAITYTGGGADFETTPSFSLTVQASDGHGGDGTVTVTVNVTDVNEPPVFDTTGLTLDSSGTVLIRVPENTTAVGTITAADPDAADTVHAYSLGGTNDQPFQVSNAGAITFRAAPDFENPRGGAANNSNEYAFVVAATGGTGSRARTTPLNVRVTVTDIGAPAAPEAPSFGTATATRIVVSWRAPVNPGPAITDYDVRYRQGASGPWTNVLDHTGTGSDGGDTATTATLTGLTAGARYQVQVRATSDEGTGAWSPSGTATAAANTAPAFQNTPYRFDLAENADGSSTAIAVGTVSATDADAGQTVSYSITAGNPGGVFAIDSSSGAITYTGGGENHEATPGISLTVRANDGIGNTAVTVTVTVTDEDEAPGAPAAPTFGSSTATSLVVNWRAPANAGPAITDYDVQYREGTSGGWTAHPHDGTARTTTIGSLTQGQSYEVQVRATNAEGTGGWSASGTATTGANAAPAFRNTPYRFTLAENADGSTTAIAVGSVSATDADAGQTVSYRIVAGNTGDVFAIVGSGANAGAITYTGTGENHETRPRFTLTVRATDGAASADATVTVTVTDVDEAPAAPEAPTFGSSTATSLVVNWTAPANTGPAITGYDVRYRRGTSGGWTAHAHDGTATTATLTGLVLGRSYQVQVRARNAEGPGAWSAPGTGMPVANNAPAFQNTPYRFTLAENADGSTTAIAVGSVSATDADAGDTVRYSITAGNTGNVFAIGSDGAITYTGTGENFEATPSFSLTVRATDSRSLPASTDVTVTVSVTDTNEPPGAPNAPTFTDVLPSRVTVSWTAPANTGPAITDYDVRYRQGTSGDWTEVLDHTGTDSNTDDTATKATLEDLTPSKSYQVQVRATNAEGMGGWSAAGTATTPAATTPDAPAAPAVLGTPGSETSLDVSWDAPYDGGSTITGYDIQYRTAAAGGAAAGSWTDHPHSGTGRTATIGSLTMGTRYEVQVRATNGRGTGGWSASGSGVAGGLAFTSPGAFEVKEHERAVGRVRVRDQAAERDLDACRRHGDSLRVAGADGALFGIACSGELSFTEAPDFENPQGGTSDDSNTYTLTVTANSGSEANRRTATQTLTVTVTNVDAPGAPENAGVTAASRESLEVHWEPPGSDGGDAVTRYEKRYSPPGPGLRGRGSTSERYSVFPFRLNANNRDDERFASFLTNLAAETDYTVWVRAVNREGAGPWAGPLQVETAVDAPEVPEPVLEALSATSLRVSWAKPVEGRSPITGYNLVWRPWSADPGGLYNVLDIGPGEDGAVPTEAVLTGLSPASRYQVKLRAVNALGEGPWSALVTGSTAGAEPARVAGLPEVSAPARGGAYGRGEPIEVRVRFTEPVEVEWTDGEPTLGLALGGVRREAAWLTGSGTDTLTFGLSVGRGDAGAGPAKAIANGIRLNGAAIRSVDGTDAVLDYGAAPGVAGVEIAAPGGGAWNAGDRVAVTVTFAEPVRVETSGGTPSVGLGLAGAGARQAGYTGGSGTDRLVFGYTLGGNDGAVSAVSVAQNALTFNNGRIVSTGGLDAALAHEGTSLTAGTGPAPLTASFSGAPAVHDGLELIEVTLTFSEEPVGLSWRQVRDSLFTVTGGWVMDAGRTDWPSQSNLRWTLWLAPEGDGAVTLALADLPACGSARSVCTADGRALSGPLTLMVPGPATAPAALSVADAAVREGPGAALAFAVTLDRASPAPVTVDYATRDGTAVAGEDYRAAEGTLTFRAGETAKTVRVRVLDDAHDEGTETMTLTLSNPRGARIADGEATGTIQNSDPAQTAWTARFGRTVADQVLDAVDARLETVPAPGSEVRLGGHAMGAEVSTKAWEGCARWRAAFGERHGLRALEDGSVRAAGTGGLEDRCRSETSEPTGQELLTGSSFRFTGGSAETGFGTLWGRGAVSRFDGREGTLTLDGEVASAFLGADLSGERTTLGLIVGHSLGDGGYSSEAGSGTESSGSGTVSSTLTGLYPWVRHALNDRVSVWGVAGYGEGSLTMTPANPDGSAQAALRTDLDLMMGAVGLQGTLVEAPETGGVELAVTTDATGVRTRSAAVTGAGGNLAAATAEVTRLRLGLEGSYPFRFEGGAVLTPSLEVGLRQDGGDAETGFGVEAGGGIAWSDPARGLSMDLKARGLVSHDSSGFREAGLSGALAWDGLPGSARGPSLTLSQSVGGPAEGGVDGLFQGSTFAGLAAADNAAGDAAEDGPLATHRFEATFGYGLPAYGDRFTMTPEVGFGLSDTGRDYRLGWRLGLARSGSATFELGLEATRTEPAHDDSAAPEHGIGLNVTARW